MTPDHPCAYCGEPAFTGTRWGADQACFPCADELDAVYPALSLLVARKMAGLETGVRQRTRRTRRRRGYTLRIRGSAWRITIPRHRVHFARDDRGWALGWLIVTPLGRSRIHYPEPQNGDPE